MPPSYFAHSNPDRISPPPMGWQALADHLRAVAKLAKQLAAESTKGHPLSHHLQVAAEIAGLLHDLGKYQAEWQQYLIDSVAGRETSLVPHAIHGAAYAGYHLGQAIALAIYGHHAGLPDLYRLANILDSKHTGLAPLLATIRASARSEGVQIPEELTDPFLVDDASGCQHYEFWTRVLFSMLVDADRLDTARFCTGEERMSLALEPGALLRRLDDERQRRSAGRKDQLTSLRNRVFEESVAAGQKPGGFFELTVPTGGGKTFSAMAFALAHASAHQLRRVIVVIPYLSIIEQNAREYKKVFGKDAVVEHHSAVGDEGQRREAAIRTAAELATENWDAPIIITTSVQFLETLLADSPKRCRKLHNILRSVVVFDEAQALPPHILNPLMNVFRQLVTNYATTIVFSTATQPAFRRSSGLSEGLAKGELTPILRESLRDELFVSLRRVRYHCELERAWSWDELVGRVADTTQALCVLNTRAQARTVWELLRARVREKYGDDAVSAVIYLSSAMCAEHRLDVFGNKDAPKAGAVRYRLQRGEPCWLMSTQVIEAGVDVDFPRAFRAIGPLDAIVQVAGRCNREGRLTDAETGQLRHGDVFVFRPAEEGMPKGFYQCAAGEAQTLLGEITEEQLATDHSIFARYFDTLYNRTSTDTTAKGEKTIQQLRAEFRYEEVARRARVIEDGGTGVIVPYGRSARRIAKIRRAGFYTRRAIRSLQRFTVNLRPNDLIKLRQLGQLASLIETDGDRGPLVLEEGSYSRELGVVITGRPIEDFLA